MPKLLDTGVAGMFGNGVSFNYSFYACLVVRRVSNVLALTC